MRKRIVLFFVFTALLNVVAPANASISSHNWIGVTFSGYDSFLGASVKAYKTGSQATLTITVYNDYSMYYPPYGSGYRPPVNVSAVKVFLDWNVYYISTEASLDNLVVIQPYQYRIFQITFTVPDVAVASNQVTHFYHIYVEHVDAAKKIAGTWTYYGSGFTVYSADQAECMEIVQKYTGVKFNFTFSEAQLLWERAVSEGKIGAISYQRGNFTDAKIHYQAMDNLVIQALRVEAFDREFSTYYRMINNLVVGLGLTLLGVGVYQYVHGRKKLKDQEIDILKKQLVELQDDYKRLEKTIVELLARKPDKERRETY